MEFNFLFVLNSVLFGIGLAMDAFSVSLANGLYEPKMSLSRMFRIAGTFGLFQTVMPLLGWVCVHTVAEAFQAFDRLIPWIALALLLFLGIRMILEGVRGSDTEQAASHGWGLFLQGIATSIDALSVGFTIADYDLIFAVTESFIIGAITLFICLAGIEAGKRIGTRVSGKASVFGGIILILIGAEIFLQGVM